MKITKENVRVVKYLSGFFYNKDLKYHQRKLDYLNEVIHILKIGDTNYDYLKVGPMDVLKIITPPQRMSQFEFRICDQNFNYEDSADYITFPEFVENSIRLALSWINHFNKPIKKAGGIIFFEVKNYPKTRFEFIKKYFQKFPMGLKQKLGEFHLNYEEYRRDVLYNINLKLVADNISKTIRGNIDINRRGDALSEANFKEIFNVLFEYYAKDVISLLNYREEDLYEK